MKKIITSIIVALPMFAIAQTAVDAYSVSQTDLKGSARYMSMAGAYSALGGDLSSINHNPGGIGVYRSSDVGLTLNLDIQSSEASTNGLSSKVNQTKFNVNNFGYVGAFRLDSETLPYLNFGFSYNRPVSYNRRYSGRMDYIKQSLSNYIADVTNSGGYTTYDLAYFDDSDPYLDSHAPWLSIMAYNSYIINPQSKDSYGDGNNFTGLMNGATQGFCEYEVIEKGGVDEFSINLGGNVLDMLYWGLGLGVSSMDLSKYTYYGEALNDATVVNNDNGQLDKNGAASFGLENWLNTSGNGLNFKFGVIVKPIQELRLGLSIHTPTYWNMVDQIYSTMSYETISNTGFKKTGLEEANAGYADEVSYKIKSPWKFNVSAATVLGSKLILSGEYEMVAYKDMNIQYEYDYDMYQEDPQVSASIKDYYKNMNIFRIGAEYRLMPSVSLRLGYAYQSSPVNEDALRDKIDIITSGTMPAYVFDKSTQYITGGVGYRNKGFYTDLAYVHKKKASEYKAFAPTSRGVQCANITDNNNQIVWSIGYRF